MSLISTNNKEIGISKNQSNFERKRNLDILIDHCLFNTTVLSIKEKSFENNNSFSYSFQVNVPEITLGGYFYSTIKYLSKFRTFNNLVRYLNLTYFLPRIETKIETIDLSL